MEHEKSCSFATSEHKRDTARMCEMILDFNFTGLVSFPAS